MEPSEIRAQTYEVLSECFKEPTPEFAGDVREGRLREFLVEAFRRMNIEHNPDGLLLGEADMGAFETLSDEYYHLFDDPFRHLAPVESAYGPTGCFMGEAARQMLALYERVGVRPPSEFAAMPDHLCLMLELMALLVRKGRPEMQSELLSRHFGWLEKLKEDSLKRHNSPFYLAAIDATAAFLRHERQSLQTGLHLSMDGRQDEGVPSTDRPFTSAPPPMTLSGGKR